jgi:hypothetical protein
MQDIFNPMRMALQKPKEGMHDDDEEEEDLADPNEAIKIRLRNLQVKDVIEKSKYTMNE